MSVIQPVPPDPPVNDKSSWFARMPTGGTVYARQPQRQPSEVDWFHRMPNGGTVNERQPSLLFEVGHRFREMPNGGGTLNVRPTDGAGGETGTAGSPDPK